MKKSLGFVTVVIMQFACQTEEKKSSISKNFTIHIYFNKLKICLKFRTLLTTRPAGCRTDPAVHDF